MLRSCSRKTHEPTRKFLAAVMRNRRILLDVTIDGRARRFSSLKELRCIQIVVVTDTKCHNLNGLELVQKLRAARIPGSVVVVSGGHLV
jgi:hypothetical protein